MSHAYFVNDVYPCVQGEGRLSGTPMVMVRLQGCHVACAFCDTRESWVHAAHNRCDTLEAALGQNPKWAEAGVVEVAALARRLGPGHRWALVSGGEPAEQELGALFRELHRQGFQVSLESSGTALGFVPKGDWGDDPEAAADHVTVSPKLGNPGRRQVLLEALERADDIKFVIGSEAELERAERHREKWGPHVRDWANWWLQPMSLNQEATALCLRAAERGAWHLSIQSHKLIGAR